MMGKKKPSRIKQLEYQLERQKTINEGLQERFDYIHHKYLRKKSVLKSYKMVIRDLLQGTDELDDLILEDEPDEELIGYS